MGFEQPLGDVRAERAGGEGVGLEAGELVERAAEFADAAHRVGEQHGRAGHPEDQQRALAQRAGSVRGRPFPPPRQKHEQQGNEQRQVQAVADLAEGISQRDVFEQTDEHQHAGRSPTRPRGGQQAGAEEKEKQSAHRRDRIAAAEPAHGPQGVEGRMFGQRRGIAHLRDGQIEHERVKRVHERLRDGELPGLLAQRSADGNRRGGCRRAHGEKPAAAAQPGDGGVSVHRFRRNARGLFPARGRCGSVRRARR